MQPTYRLHDIRFHYGKTLALSLPELEIPAEKITALIGANGSGKSTLLNLLALLESPGSGSLHLFGEKVEKKRRHKLRGQVGFLPQKPYLFRGTVVDNLTLALKLHGIAANERAEKIRRVLSLLNIDHLANQQAKTLSGGEMQKAALARALINEPKVLLMDEPFSYLDQAGCHLLENFILNHVKDTGNTLVFSTHDRLQGIAIADTVVSLVKGGLIKSPLINLFNGTFQNGCFKTALLEIFVAEGHDSACHISIDPHEIVLSQKPLDSSMRNQYQGRVTAIAEEIQAIRVSVNAGEIFQALITRQALEALKLSLGDAVWLSFKANSVVVF